jgi:hypothetical protein
MVTVPCLAMNVRSDSDTPALRWHATILSPVDSHLQHRRYFALCNLKFHLCEFMYEASVSGHSRRVPVQADPHCLRLRAYDPDSVLAVSVDCGRETVVFT